MVALRGRVRRALGKALTAASYPPSGGRHAAAVELARALADAVDRERDRVLAGSSSRELADAASKLLSVLRQLELTPATTPEAEDDDRDDLAAELIALRDAATEDRDTA